jgi:hypothetical protein
MKKLSLELRYALILLVAMWVWMIGERLGGLHDKNIELHPYITMFALIPVVIIYFLFLRSKKAEYGGSMSYKQGFLAGLILTLFSTILAPLGQYVTSTIITPHYFDNVTAYVTEHGLMKEDQARDYFSLGNYIFQSTTGSLIFGLVFSALIPLFMRKGSTATNP